MPQVLAVHSFALDAAREMSAGASVMNALEAVTGSRQRTTSTYTCVGFEGRTG
jgi:hypothetical protein